MVHDGSLNARSLLAFYNLQKRLGLPVITTTERNPLQGVSGFIREMRAFEAFETDQARAPTVNVLCDPENFGAKLRYIARRHRIVNVQWAGYRENAATWETLSRTLRDARMWCNVIGITRRYETTRGEAGKKIHPASIVPPLLLGAHTCSVMPKSYPKGDGGSNAKKGAGPRVMDFDPGTWCYGPSRLPANVARARSFNAVQGALGPVRSSILDGSFYSRACAERLGLRACLGQILARSGASREPGQGQIFD